MKKIILLLSLCCLSVAGFGQEKNSPQEFFNNIKKHLGKAYEGVITEGEREGDSFSGKRLVMHVRECEGNKLYIPFFVGENKSRTWILTLENDRILLKHDHRKEDGSDDEVTMYGGWTPNTGSANMQMFPADQFTRDLLDHAAYNVWWITIDDTKYTYNLRRIGSPRVFSVSFDLTKEVETPDAPWGWE